MTSPPDTPTASAARAGWGFTVVVPAHGSLSTLVPLLGALDAQAAGHDRLRVIVSDDASPEPLAAGLDPAAFGAIALEVVRSEANGGPGAARNRALALVDTPWVAFIDADELPGPGWLDRLQQHTGDPGAPDGVEGRLEIGGERPTAFTHATEIIGKDGGHVGGNVLYRTGVLRRLGGFDERFFDPARALHFREDADLRFRLDRAGARIEHDPDLLALHPPLPASFGGPLRLARRYYFDPLLSREHPEAFRHLNDQRRIGPVTLRRARHDASLGFALTALATAAGVAGRRRRLTRLSAAGLAATWGANVAALAWKRRVPPQDVVPLVAVAALVPWVYLHHYFRGVRDFGHRPRL